MNTTLDDLLIASQDIEALKNNIEAEKMLAKKRIYKKEEKIQTLVVEYLENKGLLFHPSMSGIYTDSFKVRSRMKKQGVRKGYPDLYIIKDNGKDKILFLELKTIKGHLSDDQIDIIEKIKAEHIPCSVSYGIYEAIYMIEMYLKGEPIIWENKK